MIAAATFKRDKIKCKSFDLRICDIQFQGLFSVWFDDKVNLFLENLIRSMSGLNKVYHIFELF